MKFGLFHGLCALALASSPAAAVAANGEVPPISAEAASAIAEAYHDAGIFDGVIVVATLDGVIFSGAYGRANIEFDVPNAAHTRVRLASVSKPFTAAMVLRLEEEGLLKTGQTVAQLLPQYAQAPFASVTVEQLLRHSSGIPNYQYKPPYQAVQSKVLLTGIGHTPVGLDDMIETFAGEKLSFEPGTQYAYTNANYILLQAIIERASGKAFPAALKTYVTDPLGLEDTGVVGFRDVVQDLATGYVMGPESLEFGLQGQYVGVAAPGGLYSTAGDMAKWLTALFGGRYFAKAATLEKMMAPRSKAYSASSFIGYGLFTSLLDANGQSIPMIGHDGWGPPFTANFQYSPANGLIVFAADNVAGIAGNTHGETVRVAEDIMRASYGHGVEPPKKPADMALAGLIREHGPEEGIRRFEAHANLANGSPRLETELNRLGYAYLSGDALEKAVAVFRLNCRLFPQSSNVWDSLGEALEAVGEGLAALGAYRKALELSPGNARLEARVERLSDPAE